MKRSAVLFFAADFTSLLGNSSIGLVLPWLVLLRTGDAAAAGTVAALSAVPGLLSAVVGGSLIDHFGRRTMIIVSDVGSAVAVALLPIVDALLGLNVGWFIVLGILGSLFDVPGMTAREAMLPDVARASGMPLDRVASVREALFGVSFLAGPAIAGIALTLLPAVTVVWLTAACSAVASALTVLLPRSLGAASRAERALPIGLGAAARAWSSHVGEGFGVLARNPVARATTLLGVGTVLAISPLQAVVMPVYFERLDAPDLLGFTFGAVAVGLIAGSLGYGVLAARVSRRAVLVGALVLSVVALISFSAFPVVPVIMAGAATLGLGLGLLNPMFPVLVAERIPESVRGRVLGLQNAGYLTAFPVGVFAAGWIVQAGGVQLGAAVTAGVWLLFAVYGLLTPGLRDLRTPDAGSRDLRTPEAD